MCIVCEFSALYLFTHYYLISSNLNVLFVSTRIPVYQNYQVSVIEQYKGNRRNVNARIYNINKNNYILFETNNKLKSVHFIFIKYFKVKSSYDKNDNSHKHTQLVDKKSWIEHSERYCEAEPSESAILMD